MHTRGSGPSCHCHGRDIVLPLDVTLEELFCGATRRVAVNRAQLRRAHHSVSQEHFDVQISKGATDGHRITFAGKANTELGADPGDVCFVLQEKRHAEWKRKGLDLYLERSITLLEALTGYSLVIEHLDGRRLAVRSRPGEIVRPRNVLPDAEAEWERYDHTDVFPGQDAGAMKTGNLEACKEICRQRGYSGFVYWEDTAYFRAQGRADLLNARQWSKGSTLFICPDPETSASVRMQRAIRGAGMPCFEDPLLRGNLFLLLKVELPTQVDAQAAELLHEVLPPNLPTLAPGHHCDVDEMLLCNFDPAESQRQHHKATGGGDFTDSSVTKKDESPRFAAHGLPPCRQM